MIAIFAMSALYLNTCMLCTGGNDLKLIAEVFDWTPQTKCPLPGGPNLKGWSCWTKETKSASGELIENYNSVPSSIFLDFL